MAELARGHADLAHCHAGFCPHSRPSSTWALAVRRGRVAHLMSSYGLAQRKASVGRRTLVELLGRMDWGSQHVQNQSVFALG
jgi:hypothetical protein